MVRSLVRNFRRVFSRLPLDPRVGFLRDRLARSREPRAAATGSAPVIAVEACEEPLYYALFCRMADTLAARTGARVDVLLMHSINGAIGQGLLPWLGRWQPIGWMIASQWERAYRVVADRVGFRSYSFDRPLQDLHDRARARRLWQELKQGRDPVTLQVDGVLLGDLVVDSFLRFRPSPRFDAHDPFVLRVLWQALRDLRRARDYFGSQRPALYLTTYSTYIEHGIAVRVALAHGTRVRSFGNFVAFGRPLTAEDSFHTPDTSGYRRDFERLDDREGRLAEAERQLAVRLSGGIDAATLYMKQSAYVSTVDVPEGVAGAVIVFLHDFYDSPHIYADLVFPDFWAWVSCTIETLREAGIPFFLKPHPNQISLSDDALRALAAQYPGARLLSAKVTNAQLAQAGISCGVTVYGTVAHELAYLGVPSIGCARHPHHAFDFCRTARSVDEYRAMLRTPRTLALPLDEMKRQALAFYYMHNLHGTPEQHALRRQFAALWKASHGDDTTGAAILQALDGLAPLAAYRDFIDTVAKEVTDHAR